MINCFTFRLVRLIIYNRKGFYYRKLSILKLSNLKYNNNNPRIFSEEKTEKLKKSIEDFPQMMELRPIVVDDSYTVLGGNFRLKALTDLGYDEIPNSWVKKASELTEDQKREFIIKDNIGFGDWDWDVLNSDWDSEELEDWGLDGFDEIKRDGWNPEKYEDSKNGDGINLLTGYNLLSIWHGLNSKEDSETYKYYIDLPSNNINPNNLNSDTQYSRTNTQEIERIVKTYMREGDYFLENCCGWSTFGSCAKFYGFSGIGIDIWNKAIEYSKKQLNLMPGNGKVEIREMDGKNTVFENETFNYVYCNPPFLDEEMYSGKYNDIATKNIDDYSENLKNLMIENFRVLKKDGLCTITINDKRNGGFLIPLQKIVIDSSFCAGFNLWDFVVVEVKSNRIRLRKKDYEKKRTVKGHEYVITFKK